MATIKSHVDTSSEQFQVNKDAMKALVAQLNERLAQVREGEQIVAEPEQPRRHNPHAHAADLRADRAYTYRKSRLTLFIEVVNATDHENYRQNGFSVTNQRRVLGPPIESLFPLLPVAGVLIEF